ncbi:MAG: FAD/NAD(P)-binding oxidoreductase, partial [Wenzhouxiangella sp.]|nr:FAD/NAD(P)-binding oxidoreductase [Wenzhouxiangella sp.]
MAGIVIVGAGQAGAAMAARLRSEGYDGPLTLLGAEPDPPYQRPPLSKAYLLGEMERERLFLRPLSFYAENRIELRLGTEVASLDAGEKRITLGTGETIGYSQLALTTGATPRKLPASVGGDLDGVFTVRALADIDALAPRVVSGARAVILGGGYIGLEAAAVARKRGMDVTVIEMAPRILARVASPETAAFVAALHEAQGVRIRTETALSRLEGDDAGAVTSAVLQDGEEIPA